MYIYNLLVSGAECSDLVICNVCVDCPCSQFCRVVPRSANMSLDLMVLRSIDYYISSTIITINIHECTQML